MLWIHTTVIWAVLCRLCIRNTSTYSKKEVTNMIRNKISIGGQYFYAVHSIFQKIQTFILHWRLDSLESQTSNPCLLWLKYTVAVYSWSIANNFVIGVYCRCLEILSQIAFSKVANCFKIYWKMQFGIESVGIYSRHQ